MRLSPLLKNSVALVFLACAAGGAAAQQQITPDPAQPPGIAGHLARAKEIAGDNPYLKHLATEGYWCKSPATGRTFIAATQSLTNTDQQPLKLFDNLYMIGTPEVDSFILKTSAGLVVWDTLDNEAEQKSIFEPGMKALGLNMADIKLVILTHGHGDHFGGAKYLQDTYHVPVALSGADWDFMLSQPVRNGVVPPARDRVLTDGENITIGDATIHIVLTPGHTPATVSSILPVKDHGVTRMMAMWGGTAYPQSTANLGLMGESMQKFKMAAAEAGAVGMLNTHAFFYDIALRVSLADPAGPNPLVIGKENVSKALDIQGECLAGMKEWYAAMSRS